MTGQPAILGGSPIFSESLPISQSTLPNFDEVSENYRDVFATGMITNHKYVEKYEETMASYLGVNHAVAVSSATSGLLLTLKCLDLEGEVILPSFTFAVSGHVVSWNGLTPIFVDIDPETCLIDPKEVEKAITPKTCAIMGVHIWGNPCAADQLQDISDRHGLPLIFDAAQATGSRYLERPVGGYGRAEIFSCSPTKVVTSGEGGIIATNDSELAAQLRIGRAYGDDGSYDCIMEGINARMSELHAIVGLASLNMADVGIIHRQDLMTTYRNRLGNIPGIRFQKTTPGGITNGVYFTIILDTLQFGMTRDQLYESLKLEKIDTRRYYYPPLHLQKVNRHLAESYRGKLPHTEAIASNSLTLPMFSHMTEEQVIGVCDAIARLHHHSELIREQSDHLFAKENE